MYGILWINTCLETCDSGKIMGAEEGKTSLTERNLRGEILLKICSEKEIAIGNK